MGKRQVNKAPINRHRRTEKIAEQLEFIRSQRGSLKPRKGEPSALDTLLAERRKERYR